MVCCSVGHVSFFLVLCVSCAPWYMEQRDSSLGNWVPLLYKKMLVHFRTGTHVLVTWASHLRVLCSFHSPCAILSFPRILFPECWQGWDPEHKFEFHYKISAILYRDRGFFFCYNKIHWFDYIQDLLFKCMPVIQKLTFCHHRHCKVKCLHSDLSYFKHWAQPF